MAPGRFGMDVEASERRAAAQARPPQHDAGSGSKITMTVTKKKDLKYLNTKLHMVEIPDTLRPVVIRQLYHAAQRNGFTVTAKTVSVTSEYLKKGWKHGGN
uniref:Uncharacterized protein n=1 Tax=Leersia perrieri TaxID=77586 RepID=A0A0D9X083_9ORYZ